MTRISKIEPEHWDPALREMTRPDTATPLEQGLMRMFAHCPGLAKGVAAFGGSLKMHRTLPAGWSNWCGCGWPSTISAAVAWPSATPMRWPMASPKTWSANSPTRHAQTISRTPNRQPSRLLTCFATNHLAIDDAVYDGLKEHFSEAQVMELGMTVAFFVGFGRLAATLHMTEELPAAFQAETNEPLSPWNEEAIVVR